jgi:hypothetical protein
MDVPMILLVQVFGEQGIHARSAVSVAQVPFGACVEIDMIAELREGETQWASVRSIARNTRCRNIGADAIVALSE